MRRLSDWRTPKMSPKAYEVASVTADAPTMEASSSSRANIAPTAGPMWRPIPWATPSASVKCPNPDVPVNAEALATMIAAAPTTTTTAPSAVSAFS